MEKDFRSTAFKKAVDRMESFLRSPHQTTPFANPHHPVEKHTRWLCDAAFKHWPRYEGWLRHLQRGSQKPGRKLLAVWMLTLGEMEREPREKTALIIDQAVGYSRKNLTRAEAGFLNACLRRASREGSPPPPPDRIKRLEWLYGHPEWAIRRWLDQWGEEATEAFLRTNQSQPEIWLQWPLKTLPPEDRWEASTAFPGFFRQKKSAGGEAWGPIEAILKDTPAYIQDPSTANPGSILPQGAGGPVLDIGSSPGGKAFLWWRRLEKAIGHVVALDLPGPRITRLQSNLQRLTEATGVPHHILEMPLDDLSAEHLSKKNLPTSFPLVSLDTPCSNSGVLRRKPEARWRLNHENLEQLTTLQSALIQSASRWVCPGGYLSYSTCSVEREENDGIIQTFLEKNPGWEMIASRQTLPWIDDCDGAGAFLLRKG